MKRATLILAAGLLCTACEKTGLCEDDKLSIAKTDYTGRVLRINGFYYGEPRADFNGQLFHHLLVLSANGMVLDCGSAEAGKFEDYVRQLTPIPDIAKRSKSGWGRFVVDGQSLTIEQWRPYQAPQCGQGINKFSGTILNDTTFVINHYEYRRNGRKQDEGEGSGVYRFRAFGPKPDSVVSFVE